MKIVFLFPGRGRDVRADGQSDGSTPREFFYGMSALDTDGHAVSFADNRRDPDGAWPLAHLKWEILRNRIMHYGTSAERVRAVSDELRRNDLALSFTDGFSLSLGRHARRFGATARLAGGFHGISTFTERTPAPFRAAAEARTRAGLHGLDHCFFFGAADRQYAIDTYGLDPARTSLFRFGIDTDFWCPARPEEDEQDGGVFSAGSDPSRDYATLLSAGIEAPIRILSGLTLPDPVPANVEQISGSFHGIAITDLVLRDIYRRAAVVAVPLLDVLQPTGYSVALQAMACGKPLVISDFRGLWDRDAFVSGENCFLVPHGDPAALREAVETLLGDADLRARIGAAARTTAERTFPLARMNGSVRELVAAATDASSEAA
ncbi:MAG: glycosyltransferase family 4 protein [Alphaproteobacteria bacterium]|nr:glycosyltransferase family 4 protein [Alphaproteobacteria bacterium]